jgi:hypothetical protein
MFYKPGPLGTLIEDDIATDVHTSGRLIVDTIRHGSWLIPDDDHQLAQIIELLLVRCHQLHVSDTPKHVEVMHARCAPHPQLV